MDENYLDNLLNEFSLDKEIDHKIEDELDNQMMEEKHKKQEESAMSDEDLFNLDLDFDADGVSINDDLHFSEEQIDELDNLDNLADLDIGDLDFSDIDFEDLDVTNLDDVKSDDFDELLKDFEGNLEIGGFSEEEAPDLTQTEELKEDVFNADSFLDTLLEETEEIKEAEEQPIFELPEEPEEEMSEPPALDEILEEEQTEMTESLHEEETLSASENSDLDDLFSMLDMEGFDDFGGDTKAATDESHESTESLLDGLEDIEDMDDIEELEDTAKVQNETSDKKKKFMEVLFGEPDEDDILSEEEIAAMEAKKEAKKAKKKAAKEARKEKADAAKEEKAFKDGQKKKAETEKKRVKAEKKAKQRAEELANAEPEKKLNKPMVIFIFSLFLGGLFLFYMASNDFNYKQAIEKASNYFANRKYQSAFAEISGVEVKEEDQELKDRIYTVMYVERLYLSYENNIKLDRQEKALDALLRGVDKYFEHYEEAGKLGITDDLDYSFSQIRDVLLEKYGISVDRAIEINALENYEYVKTIDEYIAKEQME